MSSNILLSLCIPTNGIVEWVMPVLESIYTQNVDNTLFEVVITDNGSNKKFKEAIKIYTNLYDNLIYRETSAVQFTNQIEAFKMAKGCFIKFVNHRMILKPGSLQYIIALIYNYLNDKPQIYFSNGVLGVGDTITCNSFEDYIRKLSYWSSWSAGTAIWKDQFEQIDATQSYNNLFPHVNLIFARRHEKEYVIIDRKIMEDIPVDVTKKGNYDLFYAFAVEFPSIILDLVRKGDIHLDTFTAVLADNKKFVIDLYFNYCIRKEPCSYDLSGFKSAINVYYSSLEIQLGLFKRIIYSFTNKLFNILRIRRG